MDPLSWQNTLELYHIALGIWSVESMLWALLAGRSKLISQPVPSPPFSKEALWISSDDSVFL